MSIEVDGELPEGSTAKDIILAIIGKITTGGGIGHMVEYRGSAIRNLSMEGRMTICNMSIEAGAKAGMVAPDDTTFAYIEGRQYAPKGKHWEQALDYWRSLPTDAKRRIRYVCRAGCREDHALCFLGNQPRTGRSDRCRGARSIGRLPIPASATPPSGRWPTWTWYPVHPCASCRSMWCSSVPAPTAASRILRLAASVIDGKAVATGVQAYVVPGSMRVKEQAEREGLDRIFPSAGFEWRSAGCSMCLGMNPDQLTAGQRCASTSNRNFEGRQGKGGRTHLVSPAVAAATAIVGTFATPADLR